MKHFSNAAKQALKDTALLMTADLRSHALNAGWDPEAANSLRVNDSFEVVVPDSKSDHVKSYEYGSVTQRPNAAIRQYANRPDRGIELFVKRFQRHLGGK